jgi:hypothetical protein
LGAIPALAREVIVRNLCVLIACIHEIGPDAPAVPTQRWLG